jgi:hypothetical protein
MGKWGNGEMGRINKNNLLSPESCLLNPESCLLPPGKIFSANPN